MPSITRLGERYIQDTAADSADLRVRMRYLREDGILPQSARKADVPQAEVVHCVAVMTAHLLGGTQIGIAGRVRALSHLPRRSSGRVYDRFETAGAARDQLPEEKDWLRTSNLPFAPTVWAIVHEASHLDGGELMNLVLRFQQIEVAHDGGFAVVRTPHAREDLWFGQPGANAVWRSSTVMLGSVFVDLADVVIDSRREAARLVTSGVGPLPLAGGG